MGKKEFEEITDEMIGLDDRVCSCASRVVDIIASSAEKERGLPLKELMEVLKEGRREGEQEAK